MAHRRPLATLGRHMSGSRVCLVTAAFAAIAIVAAPAQTGPPTAEAIGKGQKVAIPDAPDCVIYVAAWQNGSWFDPNVPADYRVPVKASIIDSSEARSDVGDITRWLV